MRYMRRIAKGAIARFRRRAQRAVLAETLPISDESPGVSFIASSYRDHKKRKSCLVATRCASNRTWGPEEMESRLKEGAYERCIPLYLGQLPLTNKCTGPAFGRPVIRGVKGHCSSEFEMEMQRPKPLVLSQPSRSQQLAPRLQQR